MGAVSHPAIEPGVRVSTLELFFDLVFVFTVTQLTAVLAGHLTVPGVLRVLLMLGVILWMYGGDPSPANAPAPADAGRRRLPFPRRGWVRNAAAARPAGVRPGRAPSSS